MQVAAELAANCVRVAERRAWLGRLPNLIEELRERWSLVLGEPFQSATCAWVAPAIRRDGSSAVLKIGMPHMEADHEIHGLLASNGDPMVRVFAHDTGARAALIERCEPGTPLKALPEPEQDAVIADILPRFWRVPADSYPFRPLASLLTYWSVETLADRERWEDPGLVEQGLDLFEQLPASAPRQVLLATDLHPENVLRAARKPWLAIDPKPFVGDPAYDATQHLFNCRERLLADPIGTIRRIADLLEVDNERVRLWTFARCAAEPREVWANSWRTAVANVVA